MKGSGRAVFASLLAGSLLSTGDSAAATITVFSNDLAGFTAAAGGPVVIEDFADPVLVPGLAITFGSSRPGAITGGELQDRANEDQTIKPTFSFSLGGADAFGGIFDLTPGGPATGITLFVTFTDLTTQTVGTEIPADFDGDFFGIVSDMPIASIRFDEGTQGIGGIETFDLDDVRLVFAEPGRVPEPGTLALLGAGLIGLALSRRARRRA